MWYDGELRRGAEIVTRSAFSLRGNFMLPLRYCAIAGYEMLNILCWCCQRAEKVCNLSRVEHNDDATCPEPDLGHELMHQLRGRCARTGQLDCSGLAASDDPRELIRGGHRRLRGQQFDRVVQAGSQSCTYEG